MNRVCALFKASGVSDVGSRRAFVCVAGLMFIAVQNKSE